MAEVITIRKPFINWAVGDENYKLRLTTEGIIGLENKLGGNLINVISSGIPSLTVMLQIVKEALTPYNHGISTKDVYGIFDKYVEAGGSQMDMYKSVLMPLFASSGFFTEETSAGMLEALSGQDTEA